MKIETKEDWLGSAAETIGQLPDYAAEFRCNFDAEKAFDLLKTATMTGEAPTQLHSMFEKLWSDLPDHPAIHTGPFNDLCDLCSEIWVYGEDE